jgi:hypothetical protein
MKRRHRCCLVRQTKPRVSPSAREDVQSGSWKHLHGCKGPSRITFLAPDVVAQGFRLDPTAWTIDKARRSENRSLVFLEECQHREGAEHCYHRSREGLTNGDQATVGSALSKASGQGGHPPAPCGRRPSPSSALAQSSTAKNRHCSHAHQPNNFHQWRREVWEEEEEWVGAKEELRTRTTPHDLGPDLHATIVPNRRRAASVACALLLRHHNSTFSAQAVACRRAKLVRKLIGRRYHPLARTLPASLVWRWRGRERRRKQC